MSSKKRAVLLAYVDNEKGEVHAQIAGNLTKSMKPIREARNDMESQYCRVHYKAPKKEIIRTIDLFLLEDEGHMEIFKAITILDLYGELGILELIENAFIAGYNLRKKEST